MTTTWTPFADGQPADCCGGVGGEPTALLSDDGRQIDLWRSAAAGPTYGFSPDGITFGGFQATDVGSSYLRPHVLKDGATYYLYVAGASDTTIHLFTGTDKVHFADQGQVLGLGAGGAWDSSSVSNSFVWHEGATWYMLYEASGPSTSSIGLATASAPGGPWTRYGGNPVITGTNVTGGSRGCGNPELPRWGSAVTKGGGLYYCYFHGAAGSSPGPLGRAYSADLHTWTLEGAIDGVYTRLLPVWNGSSGWSYGDHCLVPAPGGGTYLYFSPSNQVDTSYLDGARDHRTALQLLACPPAGASAWQTGCVPVPL